MVPACFIIYKPANMIRGSSTAALIFLRNITASRPSINLWSYVNATYIIGLITTCNRKGYILEYFHILILSQHITLLSYIKTLKNNYVTWNTSNTCCYVRSDLSKRKAWHFWQYTYLKHVAIWTLFVLFWLIWKFCLGQKIELTCEHFRAMIFYNLTWIISTAMPGSTCFNF